MKHEKNIEERVPKQVRDDEERDDEQVGVMIRLDEVRDRWLFGLRFEYT